MSVQDSAGALQGRRRTLAMAVVALAFVMDLLDVTIVNVAIPAIQQGLGAGTAAVQWLVAGYVLSFAVVLITGGRLGDLYGHRRLFLVGVAAFTLASLACGLVSDAGGLVVARLLQGACAALMVPQVMALMQRLYPPEERVRVFAIFGVLGGLSAALGPVIGGALIAAAPPDLGWRLCFLINLPVGLFSLAAGAWLLPRDVALAGGAQRLDLPGMALSVAVLGALMLPLIQGPEWHWPAWCLGLLAASAPLAALTWAYWRWRDRHDGAALLRPGLLQLLALRRGLLSSLLLNGIVPGYLFVATFALQQGRGLAAWQMSLLCLPIALGAMVSVGWLGQRVMQRHGSRTLLWGVGLQALSLAVTAWVLPGGAPLWPGMLLAHGLLGLGLGLVGPPLTALTLQDVPLPDAGSAAGVASAVQQVAGALAVVAVGLVLGAGIGSQALWPLAALLLLGAASALRLPRLRLAQAGLASH